MQIDEEATSLLLKKENKNSAPESARKRTLC